MDAALYRSSVLGKRRAERSRIAAHDPNFTCPERPCPSETQQKKRAKALRKGQAPYELKGGETDLFPVERTPFRVTAPPVEHETTYALERSLTVCSWRKPLPPDSSELKSDYFMWTSVRWDWTWQCGDERIEVVLPKGTVVFLPCGGASARDVVLLPGTFKVVAPSTAPYRWRSDQALKTVLWSLLRQRGAKSYTYREDSFPTLVAAFESEDDCQAMQKLLLQHAPHDAFFPDDAATLTIPLVFFRHSTWGPRLEYQGHFADTIVEGDVVAR